MRPLSLHASALTDSEYTAYTTALCDLASVDSDPNSHSHNDSYYASLSISAREARAWFRGKYASSDLSHSFIDDILKLFCPNLAVTDTLSGGQFFAAHRLATHVLQGKQLDGSLVFVQPIEVSHPSATLPSHKSLVFSPLSNSQPPSAKPSPRASRDLSEVPAAPGQPSAGPPALPPKPSLKPIPPPRPFVAPPTVDSSKPPTTAPKQSNFNPFRKSTQSATPTSHLPPLPPRKPSIPPPPPKHSSQSVTTPGTAGNGAGSITNPAFAFWQSSTASTNDTHSHAHVPSGNVLIQQSLQAGRIAQSLKRAEEKLEKERVLEVLKSSSNASTPSSSRRTRSESPNKDLLSPPSAFPSSTSSKPGSNSSASSVSSSALSKTTVSGLGSVPALPRRKSSQSERITPPPRRRSPPPPSVSSGGRSFMEVATARVSERGRDKSKAEPPPQHPDLKPSPSLPASPMFSANARGDESPRGSGSGTEDSPTARVFRSKSLHHPSPGAREVPPLPPPRRRRPESVQYFGHNAVHDTPYGMRRETSPSASGTERSAAPSTIASSSGTLPSRGHTRGIRSNSGNGTLSRHLSLSLSSPRRTMEGRERDSNADERAGTGIREESPLTSLKQTLQSFQPRLDAARYKAEAGLSKRGFVNYAPLGGEKGVRGLHREESEDRLVSSTLSTANNSDASLSVDGYNSDEGGYKRVGGNLELDDDDAGFGQDSGEETTRRNSRLDDTWVRGSARKPLKPWEVERDEMKWTAGPEEGWKPL